MFALAWRGENERTGGKGQFNTNTNEFIRKMILIRNVTTPIAISQLRFASSRSRLTLMWKPTQGTFWQKLWRYSYNINKDI